MKRIIWTLVLSVVAIGASVLPTSASSSHPCYLHECHNDYECFLQGCLDGCEPQGACAAEAP